MSLFPLIVEQDKKIERAKHLDIDLLDNIFIEG
jgi:hypothetical protein